MPKSIAGVNHMIRMHDLDLAMKTSQTKKCFVFLAISQVEKCWAYVKTSAIAIIIH